MLDLLNCVVTPARASRIDSTLPRTSAEASPLKAVQVRQPGEISKSGSDRIPRPGCGQVGIKVEACGLCPGDARVKAGPWPDRVTAD